MMQLPIELEFSVSKQDYINSVHLHHYRIVGWWMYLIITVGIFVYSISQVIQSGFQAIEFFIVALLFPMYLLYYWVILPQIIFLRATKNQRFLGLTKLRIDEKGFLVTNQYGQKLIEWDYIAGLQELKDQYLLEYSVKKVDFDVIPKSAFLSTQHLEEFYGFFEKMMDKQFERTEITKSDLTP